MVDVSDMIDQVLEGTPVSAVVEAHTSPTLRGQKDAKPGDEILVWIGTGPYEESIPAKMISSSTAKLLRDASRGSNKYYKSGMKVKLKWKTNRWVVSSD